MAPGQFPENCPILSVTRIKSFAEIVDKKGEMTLCGCRMIQRSLIYIRARVKLKKHRLISRVLKKSQTITTCTYIILALSLLIVFSNMCLQGP
jgi:hypothetical protein